MRSPHFAVAITSLSLMSLPFAVACAPGPVEQRCNSDVECASRLCILGACRDSAEVEAQIVNDEVADPNDNPIENNEDITPDPTDDPNGEEPGDGAGNGVDDVDDVDEIECNGDNGIIVYDDLDLDGHGAGEGRCVFDVSVGESELADDCNDDDANVFALTTVFDDVDGDGFTAGSRIACANPDSPSPPGIRFARSDAPVHVVAPNRAVEVTGDWEGNILDPIAAEPFGIMDFSRFACAAVPSRVSGLNVRVLVEDYVHDTPRPIEVEVRVTLPDGVVSSTFAQEGFVEGYGYFGFGGQGDLLGLLAVTPEDVCHPDFTVRVLVDGSETLTSLFGVEVAVAAFGVEDCDDALDESFSPANVRADDDGDGVGFGDAVSECVGGEVPYGRAVRDGDCAPGDARAFPGQRDMFTSPRQGVGGFDFNCDGQVEKEAESVNRMVAGSCTFDGSFCNWTQNQVNPSCGSSVTVFGYCQAGCHTETFTQGCR